MITTHRLWTVFTGLAVLVVIGCALGGCRNSASERTRADAEATIESSGIPSAKAEADSVVVYYFHGNKRCKTCQGIQQAIQGTIRERFSAETGSKVLVFREVNIDESANAHFIQDFDLSSSSMVVVAKNGDRTVKWENCAEVWPLAHQQAALQAYVEKQLKSYLQLVRS